MNCPVCNARTTVRESRRSEDGASVRRRRECLSCGRRFTTQERLERPLLFVRKRDGARQPFDREKLRGGLARAAHKRPVTDARIDAIVDAIEAEAGRTGGELPAARIGEMCLEGLRSADRIAYLQFASVYKQLDVAQVQAELARLAAEPGPVPETSLPDAIPQIAASRDTVSVRLAEDAAQPSFEVDSKEI